MAYGANAGTSATNAATAPAPAAATANVVDGMYTCVGMCTFVVNGMSFGSFGSFGRPRWHPPLSQDVTHSCTPPDKG
jgi:hypothetical protein